MYSKFSEILKLFESACHAQEHCPLRRPPPSPGSATVSENLLAQRITVAALNAWLDM